MDNIKLTLPDLGKYPNPYKGIERVNQPITDINAFKEYFNLVTAKQIPKSKKYYCVMLFVEEGDITGNYYNYPENWINTRNMYFRNGQMALETYANTPCPASQLIDAESIKELIEKRNQMLLNFKDEKFLDELHESI